MITLRFTYNPTMYNRAIRFFTWYPYTHVDLVVEAGIFISSIPGKGVHFHTKQAQSELFMELDVDRNLVMDYMRSQLGKPYDWQGICAMPFRRDWQEDDKWFCSELVAAAINKAKPTFSEKEFRITPRDIAMVCSPCRSQSTQP
jgi:uncharacterized protein YycO